MSYSCEFIYSQSINFLEADLGFRGSVLSHGETQQLHHLRCPWSICDGIIVKVYICLFFNTFII